MGSVLRSAEWEQDGSLDVIREDPRSTHQREKRAVHLSSERSLGGSSSVSLKSSVPHERVWICKDCTVVNDAGSTECGACGGLQSSKSAQRSSERYGSSSSYRKHPVDPSNSDH